MRRIEVLRCARTHAGTQTRLAVAAMNLRPVETIGGSGAIRSPRLTWVSADYSGSVRNLQFNVRFRHGRTTGEGRVRASRRFHIAVIASGTPGAAVVGEADVVAALHRGF